MCAFLIPQRKEKDILFVFPPRRGLEHTWILHLSNGIQTEFHIYYKAQGNGNLDHLLGAGGNVLGQGW